MHTITNATDAIALEKEMKGWDEYDERIREFINPIFEEVMRECGKYLEEFGKPPHYFGDDDVDYITATTDLIAAVLHLRLEGSRDQLIHFLFNTEDDHAEIIYSVHQVDLGGGTIHTIKSLTPFRQLADHREYGDPLDG